MGITSENKPENKLKKQICIGILAHVDAGKTTLSEGMMYLTGNLRKAGRVDHGDAFLDTFALERERGITIFSKQAVFELGDKEITLLDTPGHVDFSAEMERTLQVLDYAILVINGADGIQGHTVTLWNLLKEYQIPVFLFVNKMDQDGTDRDALLQELRSGLSDGCIPFDAGREEETCMEDLAMCDECVLEYYMENGFIPEEDICRLIGERKVFPCYFGAALRMQGVEELLNGLETYMRMPEYSDEFGAKVFKISRDEQGNRLTHLKVTGGSLKVKMPVFQEEKADQIRIYSGAKYQLQREAGPGTICAVTGLSGTFAGQGLGMETKLSEPRLEPVLTCQMILPEGVDVTKTLRELKQLEEEDPQLHLVWNSQLGELHVQLMGEVQTEILKSLIEERFHLQVEFGSGNIMYKETIRNTVSGVGHYEPLRHYAEVHLLLEPGEPGSGLVFASECSEDVLDKNWQRLILTHLQEKEHIGVLAGVPITDMKITLTAGRAHLKHTEGGDFRQATYRAVRQGLKSAESVLLEPWYEFRLVVPSEQVGRSMADIQKMCGNFETPEMKEDGSAVLTGSAPVSEMKDYQKEVWSYTGGHGKLFLRLKGYEPCHNEEEVLQRIDYNCEGDLDNPTGSIFCAHGAGFFVPWDEVSDYMHIRQQKTDDMAQADEVQNYEDSRRRYAASCAEDKELEAIFLREFGSKKQQEDRYNGYRRKSVSSPSTVPRVSSTKQKNVKKYLLVDGYNIIFAWDFLKELSEVSLDAARNKLMDILCNYQGFVGCTLIVVFDAYKVKGSNREVFRYHNIHVVYTKEAETADQYIEKTTHELGKKYDVTVATSDGLEQVIVMGQGATRWSARDFYEEIERVNTEIRRMNEEKKMKGQNYLFDHMDENMADFVEQVRLGKAAFDKE